MSKMTEKNLRRRDAKRSVGEELLRAVQEMKAGVDARPLLAPNTATSNASSSRTSSTI